MKSLKVVVLVLAIGLVPLVLGVVAVKQRSADRAAEDRALQHTAAVGAARLQDGFGELRASVLITAHNPTFRDFYRVAGDRYQTIVSEGKIMDRINGALVYLSEVHPNVVVQASFVDGSGAENARVVRGSPEAPHGLADDVSALPFFQPTLSLKPGATFQSGPYLSRTSGEWVLAQSTLVTGGSRSLIQVEQRIESLRQALAEVAGPYELVVLDAAGHAILDSRRPQSTGVELGAPNDRRFARAAGRSGLLDAASRRIAAVPVTLAEGSVNDWTVVAVSGPVGTGIVGLDSLPLGLAVLLLLLVALVMGKRWVRTSAEALTDPLTALGNRRKLTADLDRLLPAATETDRLALVLLDLDGFKLYNDAYGHPAGDALLARLAARLAQAVGAGAAYRLGGDEFCVLGRIGDGGADAVVEAAVGALAEQGEGFSIGCTHGVVVLPTEETEAAAALRIADARLYAAKQSGRRSAGQQSSDVLLQALRERHPELESHLRDVGEFAVGVGSVLGLAGDDLDRLRHAGQLHDVGKMAIPDAILLKPGPLDETEWEFVRQHTLIGERIIAAAPALAEVASLVRSSHERWDGSGYPERLAGDAIPLGSRIIAVCDAYDAMVARRPYRFPMSERRALDELRDCAGTQFDPAVVEAFCTVLEGIVAQGLRAVS